MRSSGVLFIVVTDPLDRVRQGSVENLRVVHHFPLRQEQTIPFTDELIVVDAREVNRCRPLDERQQQHERCLRLRSSGRRPAERACVPSTCSMCRGANICERETARARSMIMSRPFTVDKSYRHVQQGVATRSDAIACFTTEELGPAFDVVCIENGAVFAVEVFDLRAQLRSALVGHRRGRVGEVILHFDLLPDRDPHHLPVVLIQTPDAGLGDQASREP